MAGASPAAIAAGDYYGINSGGEVFSMAPETRDAHLAKMRESGITVVRTDASWGGAEPTSPTENGGQHRYRWQGFDDLVGALARQGLRWYPILCYSTAWSGVEPGNMFSPPANVADYTAYVSAFARRYGRGGSFWAEHPELPALHTTSYEIWNEPNFDIFWSRQSDAPERYAELYLATREAVHAVDQEADAVVGGLIDLNGEEFVRRMYAHRPDLRGRVDALGFHPYRQEGGPLTAIASMRRTLDRAGGRNVPIELTEIGWRQSVFSEADRARILRTLARKLPTSGLNVTRIMPYVWLGGEWGLMNADHTPKLIATAYRDAIQTTVGPQMQRVGGAVMRSSKKVRASKSRMKAHRRRAARR
jgi:hypothetical protein